MTGGLLGGLWTASLLMAASSVLFMTGLVIARLISEAGRARRRARREALVADMMSAMDGEADAARLKSEVREPRLVAHQQEMRLGVPFGRQLEAVQPRGAERGGDHVQAVIGNELRHRAVAIRVAREQRHAPRRWKTSPDFPGLAEELPPGAPLNHPLFPVLWPR